MPWCPVCKNEYKEGYTVCADCNVPLLDSLDEVPTAIYFGEERELAEMVRFLQSNGIPEAYVGRDEKEGRCEIFVSQVHVKSAKRMLKSFLKERGTDKPELEDIGLSGDGEILAADQSEEIAIALADEEPESGLGMQAKQGSLFDTPDGDGKADAHMMAYASDEAFKQIAEKILKEEETPLVYQNKHEKAAEYRSSAWALLIVGIEGLFLIAVNELGILPFQMNFNKVMVYGVMGTVFILFILIGIYSFMQTKKILTQAEDEDSLKEQINAYLALHFGREQLDEIGRMEDAAAKSAGNEDADVQAEGTGDAAARTEENGDTESSGDERLYFTRTNIMKEVLAREFKEADRALIEQLVDDHYDQVYS